MIEAIGMVAEAAESPEATESFSSIESSISKDNADAILEDMLNEKDGIGVGELPIFSDRLNTKIEEFNPDKILKGWLNEDNKTVVSVDYAEKTNDTSQVSNDLSQKAEPNIEYTRDDNVYKTDDLGNDFLKNDELIPDNTYKKDGHTYTTDKDGNVILKDGENIKLGGSYKEVTVPGEGYKKEVHHMPSNDSTDLSLSDGPSIKMDKQDHRQTASCGNSKEAQEYREMQRELVKNGKFREAMQMDIDDIKEKFGDKYDNAISEMLAYVDKLEKEGKI